MPQLDKFTYLTQILWFCLLFFSFYIFIWNSRDGVLGISRLLKLRNQLLSHRVSNIRSKDQRLEDEDILSPALRTGLSYMYSSLFFVSQWCCFDTIKSTFLCSFGEISGSRGMERNICLLKSLYKHRNEKITRIFSLI